MSCDSSNLLYVIICSGCNEEYIGETGKGTTKLRDRVRVYHEQINDEKYRKKNMQKNIYINAQMVTSKYSHFFK